MARPKKTIEANPAVEAVSKSLDTPERFKMSEAGYLGLNIFSGVTNDELKRELNFPNSVKTYKEMSYHSAINAALTLYRNLITKVDFYVKPPKDATEAEKKQCEIIESMMDDMDEQSWVDFVTDCLSVQTYGFSVHEKVYRRRYKSNGSKYDDGVIGWKRLPIRSQETIEKFIMSDDGNDIAGVKQNLSRISDTYGRFANRKSSTIVLPRSKFMLFRTGAHKGDPFGKSPLRDAYTAWRYLSIIEEIEANGAAKDLTGLPVLHLPPDYLRQDATPQQKVIRSYYENVMRNLQLNQQSSLILPMSYDESGKPLFKLELLSLDGKKAMDTDKIKAYYKNLIFISLFADILQMGQSATGSFALGQIKNSLSGNAAEALLSSIVQVLNKDLIRQTYELNGWDASRAGVIKFANLESEDLEVLSKAIQRYASTALLEKDRSILNRVRESIGVDALPEDQPVDFELLGDMTSRSGDGFATAGEGTATSVSGNDTSSNNLENAA